MTNAIDANFLRQVGRDHHGSRWPLYLRAYDDYREGLFVYIATPLTNFLEAWIALRLVAATAGVSTVVLGYWLSRKMFGPAAGIATGFFLATDPQHVLWSRLGMEVVLVPLGITLSWLALLRCGERRFGGALLLTAALIMTIYSGMMGKPAALLFVLATLLGCPYIVVGYARSRPVEFVLSLSLTLMLSVPALQNSLGNTEHRFLHIRLQGESFGELAEAFAMNFVTYWSPRYLLLSSDQGLPNLGIAGRMLVIEWLALLAGVAALLFGRQVPFRFPLLSFVLLAAVPASLTNSIAPSRMLFATPVMAVVMGLGIQRSLGWIGRRITIILLVVGISAGASAVIYGLLGAPQRLDQFFWCDQLRTIESLAQRSDRLRVVDSSLPFALEYVIFATDASTADVLVAEGNPRLRVGILPLDRVALPPGTLIATWKNLPMPDCETLSEDGRFKIVRTLPPKRSR